LTRLLKLKTRKSSSLFLHHFVTFLSSFFSARNSKRNAKMLKCKRVNCMDWMKNNENCSYFFLSFSGISAMKHTHIQFSKPTTQHRAWFKLSIHNFLPSWTLATYKQTLFCTRYQNFKWKFYSHPISISLKATARNCRWTFFIFRHKKRRCYVFFAIIFISSIFEILNHSGGKIFRFSVRVLLLLTEIHFDKVWEHDREDAMFAHSKNDSLRIINMDMCCGWNLNIFCNICCCIERRLKSMEIPVRKIPMDL
jgi:hypothetical protein